MKCYLQKRLAFVFRTNLPEDSAARVVLFTDYLLQISGFFTQKLAVVQRLNRLMSKLKTRKYPRVNILMPLKCYSVYSAPRNNDLRLKGLALVLSSQITGIARLTCFQPITTDHKIWTRVNCIAM